MRPIHYHRVNRRYKHSNYGLSPNFRFDGGAVTISDDLPNRILLGTINVKADVTTFTEHGAKFEDGTELDDIDVVILGTGYNFSFPFLDKDIIKIDGHFPYLYELVWPTQLHPPTLAVVGLVQPFGALPPILEIQARWASVVFSGTCKLPSVAKREAFIEKRRSFIKAKFVDSPRYSLQIYFIQYIDRVAQHIGCKPQLWKHFFQNPSLWYKIYFGPATPPQWRLDGPGSWKGAAEAISKVEEKTWYPVKTRAAGKGERDGLYDGWIKLFKRIVLFGLVFFLLRYVFANGYVTFPVRT